MKVVKFIKKHSVELRCIETLSQLRVGIFYINSKYSIVLQYVEFNGETSNIDLYKATNLATVESFQRWLASDNDYSIWTIDVTE